MAEVEQKAQERMEAALRPFGWTMGGEFWRRYYTDPWVFNLANAVQRLSEQLAAANRSLELRRWPTTFKVQPWGKGERHWAIWITHNISKLGPWSSWGSRDRAVRKAERLVAKYEAEDAASRRSDGGGTVMAEQLTIQDRWRGVMHGYFDNAGREAAERYWFDAEYHALAYQSAYAALALTDVVTAGRSQSDPPLTDEASTAATVTQWPESSP